MFEKLKDLSRLIVLPVSVLYFFGFLSISAYYARFGIVSFDIINSRFIIAGFFSSFSFIVAIYLSWWCYKILPTKRFVEFHTWKDAIRKPFVYFSSIGCTFIASVILQAIFNLGNFTKTLKEENLIYKVNFGQYDIVSDLVNKISLTSPSLNFILRASLHISSYLFLSALIVVLVNILVRWIKDVFMFVDKKPHIDDLVPVEIKKNVTTDVGFKENNFYLNVAFILVHLFSVTVVGSVFFYSLIKLYVNILDFNSLPNFHPVNSGLIFAWLFTTEVFIYLFMSTKEFPKEVNKLGEFLKKMNNLDNIQHAFQILIIPVLGALFLFGVTVFPRIPYVVGGGQPREVKITFKNGSTQQWDADELYLIGENGQFVFLVTYPDSKPAQAVQVNKNIIDAIRTGAGFEN